MCCKMKRNSTILASMMMVMGICANVYAAHDENLNSYTLDTIIVEADAIKNKFGDTITEQSYYRTGGDVKVITREEIEKRHYTDVTEAIKRIPGVYFQNPGYRGNGQYGWLPSQNGVSINGDSRVVFLVDGRRVDNLVSEKFGSNSKTGSKATGTNIDQIVNMENVDKIEVIKGPGASQYGSDATGGVINIITRKGGTEGKGSVDISTGSWNKHKYSLNYSGSAGNDKSWHYFISANRDMSQDTKYKDGISGATGELYGSRWKEDGVNIRVDKDFNDKQNLKVWYNFKEGKDGYPLTVPAMQYMNLDDWNKTVFRQVVGQQWDANALANGKYQLALDPNGKPIGGAGWSFENPERYRNMFAVDGAYGAFSKFKNQDWDIQYTFNKENGMDSYVRIYDQKHRYSYRDKYVWGINPDGTTTNTASSKLTDLYHNMYPSGATKEQLNQFIKDYLVPFPGNEEAMNEFINKTGGKAGEPTSWKEENNRGIQLQYAKTIGINDIIASISYDKAKLHTKKYLNDGSLSVTTVERKSTTAYVQDKIHVSDKWDLTPSLRYAHYSSFSDSNTKNNAEGKGSTHLLTPSLQTQYMFDDTASVYGSWTKIFRPIRRGDYTSDDGITGGKLEDEKGNAWTLGVRKDLSDKTTIGANYNWTQMSNAIATLPVVDMGTGDIKRFAVNAKEDMKSFNLTLDHNFDDHLSANFSYSHMTNEWKAKNGWVLAPNYIMLSGNDVNVAINRLRPANHYSLNVSYENRDFYSGLLANYYTGADDNFFTDNRFLILDFNVNYKINKDLTVYGLISNLTNEAYETSYNSSYGRGAAAMPSRCYMIGMKYSF